MHQKKEASNPLNHSYLTLVLSNEDNIQPYQLFSPSQGNAIPVSSGPGFLNEIITYTEEG